MEQTFVLNRKTYRGLTTIGEIIFPDGRKFHTLEDCVRAWGIKDAGNTSIPAGTYFLDVTMSQKFGREMVTIYTEPNKYEIKASGIGFKGCRFHGGNTNKDVIGCVAIAKNLVNDQTIQGTAEKEMTEAVRSIVKKGDVCKLVIVNQPQSE